MTRTYHSDDHADRLWELSAAAYRLHDHALIWSNRALTDGFIPASRLVGLAPLSSAECQRAVTELVAAGVWAPEPHGYRLVRFHEDQEAAADVLARRHRNAERMREQRAAERARAHAEPRAAARAEPRAPRAHPRTPAPATVPVPVPGYISPGVPTEEGTSKLGTSDQRASVDGPVEPSEDEAGWERWPPEFRDAWHERGFRNPPTQGQRQALRLIVDAGSDRAATWLREPRARTKAADVIGHLFARWDELRQEVSAREARREKRPRREPAASRGGAPAKVSTVVQELLAESPAEGGARPGGPPPAAVKGHSMPPQLDMAERRTGHRRDLTAVRAELAAWQALAADSSQPETLRREAVRSAEAVEQRLADEGRP